MPATRRCVRLAPPNGQGSEVSRPFKTLDAAQCSIVAKLAGYGLTLAQISHVLEISERTLLHEQQRNPPVAAALEGGRAMAQARVGQALYERALAGDIRAIVWWEMTRAGKRATRPLGADGSTATVVKLVVERTDGSPDDRLES